MRRRLGGTAATAAFAPGRPQLFKLPPSPPPSCLSTNLATPFHPMPFEDDLQLALDATASEHLPRQLNLGAYAYSWTNGKLKQEGATPGFRKLRAEELRQLMRRLQAAPQHHVIWLNLYGHDIGDDMMRELAEPIAALKALQVLILEGKSPPHLLPRAFVLWRQVHFHTLQGTISATTVAQR